jgi:hypothetical protein
MYWIYKIFIIIPGEEFQYYSMYIRDTEHYLRLPVKAVLGVLLSKGQRLQYVCTFIKLTLPMPLKKVKIF